MSPLKVALALALFATGDAFLPRSIRARSSSRLSMAGPGDVQWENTGPEWKSDSQGGNTPFQSGAADWGATDTPDFFEEDYDPDKGPQFSDGVMGSTGLDKMKADKQGNAGPGIDIIGAVDPSIIGGIQQNTDVPDGVVFEAPAHGRFEGEISMSCAAASSVGAEHVFDVKPVCMTFEDYYCGWTADTHPSFSVAPMTGRMDRRGGEPTTLKVTCATSQPGVFVGTLCMVLPDDDEQFTYKVTCTAN